MVHVQFKIDNINMKKYKLGDFLDNYGDGIHGTPKYDINGDYYFINGSNLGNGKIVINDDIQKVSAEEYTKIRRPIVNGQTILVSINGTLGKFAIYHGEKIGLGKSACFLNLKEAIYVPFIFAILMTKEFKTYLHNIAGQSTIKNVSPNQIANYEFYAPSSLCDCIAYSQTISKINEKIELNRQINDNLEAMAKQLYDYWFVQFDFPNEEGKPYKSNGGVMVWNEMLKREIPQGWNDCKIKEFMRIFTGKKDVSKAVPGNYKFFSCAPEPISSNEYIYDGYAVLVSGNGSYTGRVGFYKGKFDLYQRTYACVLDEDEHNISFFYYTLRYLFQPIYSGGKHGSSIPYIVLGDLADFRFAFNETICTKFVDAAKPMFDEQLLRQKEIEALTKQRDELLPLLMNGQASVNSD